MSVSQSICGKNEEDVSEANILASEVSKLSTGARISRGTQGPEILVSYISNLSILSIFVFRSHNLAITLYTFIFSNILFNFQLRDKICVRKFKNLFPYFWLKLICMPVLKTNIKAFSVSVLALSKACFQTCVKHSVYPNLCKAQCIFKPV